MPLPIMAMLAAAGIGMPVMKLAQGGRLNALDILGAAGGAFGLLGKAGALGSAASKGAQAAGAGSTGAQAASTAAAAGQAGSAGLSAGMPALSLGGGSSAAGGVSQGLMRGLEAAVPATDFASAAATTGTGAGQLADKVLKYSLMTQGALGAAGMAKNLISPPQQEEVQVQQVGGGKTVQPQLSSAQIIANMSDDDDLKKRLYSMVSGGRYG